MYFASKRPYSTKNKWFEWLGLIKLEELKKGFSKTAGWQAVVTFNAAVSHHDTHHSQLFCAGATQPQAKAFLTAVIHRNHKYTMQVGTHIDTYISVCFMPQLKSSMSEQS